MNMLSTSPRCDSRINCCCSPRISLKAVSSFSSPGPKAISTMPVSGIGVCVETASYRQAGARQIQPLADDLGNAEIGALLDIPLINGAAGFEPCLTSDQWASLLQQRRSAGRPLHLAEVR